MFKSNLRSNNQALTGAVLVMAALMLPPLSIAEGQTPAASALYNFTGQNGDGADPWAGVVIGPRGALYGTTRSGGIPSCGVGCGTVFELMPPLSGASGTDGHWTERVIHRFDLRLGDGWAPAANLVFGPDGSLYGTTLYGGAANTGTIFELKPPGIGAETITYTIGFHFLLLPQGT